MSFFTKARWIVLTIVVVIGICLLYNLWYNIIPLTQDQRLNKECEKFGKNFLKRYKNGFSVDSKIGFFYSKRLDTCVMTNVDELGNEYSICDAKRNYIKKSLEDLTICGGLFYCDKDGVDNVILSRVEKYNGNPYINYVDNGEGGEPRAIKTPDKPYSRKKCEYLYVKKIKEIK